MTQEYRNEDPTLSDALLAEPEPAGEPDPAPARTKGLGRIFRGNRALWVTSLVAVLCLVAGLVVGRFVMSPADAAENTNAPKPGYITVPVEYGELSNDVTLRGQVGYADATEVKLTASELAEAAVVTGHVPAVGDDLEAGSIALEIAGRPVFVLPGQLPSYRTLRIGMSGPDSQHREIVFVHMQYPHASVFLYLQESIERQCTTSDGSRDRSTGNKIKRCVLE